MHIISAATCGTFKNKQLGFTSSDPVAISRGRVVEAFYRISRLSWEGSRILVRKGVLVLKRVVWSYTTEERDLSSSPASSLVVDHGGE